ncbi:uncharacterized protein AB675_1899 [Cyphellophora attinorum]|uniref:Uncharacterized protein n=1 Tax=Cyphellophora attinorum TaxID=1664694 RepID=A0A0N1HE31_9EURO|nr:uncharacterized protein AB675_1899 [Phialophora attinorum]KPI42933.1 hypothetical protein AB675_1899 [Phialophora attinorum]
MLFGHQPSKGMHVSSVVSYQGSVCDEDGIKTSSHRYEVVRRHKGTILLRYWIHVIAVLATTGISALNFFEIFLIDDDDRDIVIVLNAFQFVARLHEAMLLGSLILVLMDTVRSKLVSVEGVSLGHLLSPFTFTNFDFLGSGQFWRCLQFKSGTLTLSLLLVFAIPFANVAGPLSAITIVPRLGWSNSANAAIFPQFFNASSSNFWPAELNTADLPAKCTGPRAGLEPGCPGMGLNQTLYNMDYDNTPGALCLNTGFDTSCNISMSSTLAANAITRLLSIDFNRNALSAYGTAPNNNMHRNIARKFENGISFREQNLEGLKFIEADKTQLIDMHYSTEAGFLKPAVATSCQELNGSSAMQLIGADQAALNWSTPTVTWLADIDGGLSRNFLFSYRIDTPGLSLREACRDDDCFRAPTSLYQSDPQPKNIFAPGKSGSVSLRIKKDWLDDITLPDAPTMAEAIIRLLNNWGVPFSGSADFVTDSITSRIAPTNHSVAVAVILTATITESLAQLPADVGQSLYNGNCSDTTPGFAFPPEICTQSPSHWINARKLDVALQDTSSMITFSVRRRGYGWFTSDSSLVYVALGVLLSHALATAIYLVCILVVKKAITTRWSSAAELIILAIDSFRAPELIGSTVKVEDSQVWRKKVTLREVDDGGRLSLIVGDPRLYPERVGEVPRVKKKYQ